MIRKDFLSNNGKPYILQSDRNNTEPMFSWKILKFLKCQHKRIMLVGEQLQKYGVIYENSEKNKNQKSKAVPLHAMEAFRGRGDIAPTHS